MPKKKATDDQVWSYFKNKKVAKLGVGLSPDSAYILDAKGNRLARNILMPFDAHGVRLLWVGWNNDLERLQNLTARLGRKLDVDFSTRIAPLMRELLAGRSKCVVWARDPDYDMYCYNIEDKPRDYYREWANNVGDEKMILSWSSSSSSIMSSFDDKLNHSQHPQPTKKGNELHRLMLYRDDLYRRYSKAATVLAKAIVTRLNEAVKDRNFSVNDIVTFKIGETTHAYKRITGYPGWEKVGNIKPLDILGVQVETSSNELNGWKYGTTRTYRR
jgi:hypothetical protein